MKRDTFNNIIGYVILGLFSVVFVLLVTFTYAAVSDTFFGTNHLSDCPR